MIAGDCRLHCTCVKGMLLHCLTISDKCALLIQSKPNLFQIEAWVLPPMDQALACGWFDAVMPDCFSPDGNLLANDVWASVACHYMHQSRVSMDTALAMVSKRGIHGNPERLLKELDGFGAIQLTKFFLKLAQQQDPATLVLLMASIR